eukprot:scaffold24667_cov58-Phaeocystis_antarctica.AAC.8
MRGGIARIRGPAAVCTVCSASDGAIQKFSGAAGVAALRCGWRGRSAKPSSPIICASCQAGDPTSDPASGDGGDGGADGGGRATEAAPCLSEIDERRPRPRLSVAPAFLPVVVPSNWLVRAAPLPRTAASGARGLSSGTLPAVVDPEDHPAACAPGRDSDRRPPAAATLGGAALMLGTARSEEGARSVGA